MKLRDAKLPLNFGAKRSSEDFLEQPPHDPAVIAELEKMYPSADLIHAEAYINDKARLEHCHWANCLDWHTSSHKFVVDDDSGIVYIIIEME